MKAGPRRSKARRATWRLLGTAIAGLLLVELAARYVFDFPLYGADDEVGYWLQPNQSGTFMLNKQWHFNADSLGVAEPFAPSPQADILLVGDSLVFGGNELDQSERLGPNVEALTGAQVWPMAAGSWGIPNELAFLRRKPKLAEEVDAIVWVINSGDFGPGSVWKSETTHPRQRPMLYLGYVFDKVASRYVASAPETLPPAPTAETLSAWSAFAGKLDKPLVVIAYNTQGETGSGCRWAPPPFAGSAYGTAMTGSAATAGASSATRPIPMPRAIALWLPLSPPQCATPRAANRSPGSIRRNRRPRRAVEERT